MASAEAETTAPTPAAETEALIGAAGAEGLADAPQDPGPDAQPAPACLARLDTGVPQAEGDDPGPDLRGFRVCDHATCDGADYDLGDEIRVGAALHAELHKAGVILEPWEAGAWT